MKCKNNFVSLAFFNILLLFSVVSCSTGQDWYNSEPLEVLLQRYNNEADFVNSLLQNPQEMKKMILESDYYLDGVTNLRNAESTRLREIIEFTNNLDIRSIDIRNYYHRTDRKVYKDCVFLSVWLRRFYILPLQK